MNVMKSKKEKLKADVDNVGEVHATVAEHDKQLEIRRGQVEWRNDHFVVKAANTPRTTVAYEHVISWEIPDEIWH